MRRLTRQRLQTLFVVALATADKVTLSWFRSRNRLEREKGRERLAAELAAKIDNDSSMVLVTEPVGEPINSRPGKWGVDEPDPTASA
jgi:hypothetical protein